MKKRLIALALSLTLAMGLASTAFASGSPTSAPAPTPAPAPAPAPGNSKVTVASGTLTTSTKISYTATVTKVAKKKNVSISATLKANGITYKVTTIGAKAVGSKTKTLTLAAGINTFKKNSFANAKNLKTLRIKCKKGTKASSYKISKNAFKSKYTKKATIRVSSKMTKKEFRKLVKKFRNAGFKGKIYRVKV